MSASKNFVTRASLKLYNQRKTEINQKKEEIKELKKQFSGLCLHNNINSGDKYHLTKTLNKITEAQDVIENIITDYNISLSRDNIKEEKKWFLFEDYLDLDFYDYLDFDYEPYEEFLRNHNLVIKRLNNLICKVISIM